jgi:hypothetical protein
MAQATVPPRYDIHKFIDVKPKLDRENWMSWKRDFIAVTKNRGLYKIITGADRMPTNTNQQEIDDWEDKNNAAYAQILLYVTPELQTAIDQTDSSEEAWKILMKKYESNDPSKVSIVRTRYEHYHMKEGQSVVAYITVMKEYRYQLFRMGETITDSTHAATLLRNVPASWRSITQTIRMMTRNLDEIEEKMEAHEADSNAADVTEQAATAFIAHNQSLKITDSQNSKQATDSTNAPQIAPKQQEN